MDPTKFILSLTVISSSILLYLNNNTANGDGYRVAQLTAYQSYAPCCQNSPNYDSKASTQECDDFSACKYTGGFSAIGHKSFEYVRTNNLLAFYDDTDPNGTTFLKNYGGKSIKLRKNGIEFTAQIADTCGNPDCNNCCHINSMGGFLVDLEYYTAVNNLGGLDQVGGTIEFMIV